MPSREVEGGCRRAAGMKRPSVTRRPPNRSGSSAPVPDLPLADRTETAHADVLRPFYIGALTVGYRRRNWCPYVCPRSPVQDHDGDPQLLLGSRDRIGISGLTLTEGSLGLWLAAGALVFVCSRFSFGQSSPACGAAGARIETQYSVLGGECPPAPLLPAWKILYTQNCNINLSPSQYPCTGAPRL